MFKVSVCNLVFDVQNCCREFVPLYTELRTACYVIFCCYDHFHHVLTYSYIVQSSNSIPNHELDFIFYFLFYFLLLLLSLLLSLCTEIILFHRIKPHLRSTKRRNNTRTFIHIIYFIFFSIFFFITKSFPTANNITHTRTHTYTLGVSQVAPLNTTAITSFCCFCDYFC